MNGAVPPRIVLLGAGGDPFAIEEDALYAPMESSEPLVPSSALGLLFDACTNNSEAFTRRQVDISKLLREGGTLVLFIGPGVSQGASQALGQWILQRLGLPLASGGPWEVRPTSAGRLGDWLHDQVAHARIEPGGEPAGFHPLGQVFGNDGSSLGWAAGQFDMEKASVVLVPLRTWSDWQASAIALIKLLPEGEEYPSYLDQLVIGDEAAVLERLSLLSGELGQLEERRRSAQQVKGILHRSGISLELEVVRFLNDEIDVQARHMPGNREDFRLVDGEQDWLIGEVKSRESGNLNRGDVGALAAHRSEAALEDEFPGLLVGNTFFRWHSVSERDAPISPEVFRWAASGHITVVRTLDLVRIKQALAAGNSDPREALLESARQGGGWLEVDSRLNYRLLS